MPCTRHPSPCTLHPAPCTLNTNPTLTQCWRHACEHLAERLPLSGLGVAVPGNVDPAAGTTRYLPNFGWLEPVDLTARLLELPITELADRTST